MQRTIKKTRYSFSFLNNLQFVIAIIIAVLYALSLWQPNFYDSVSYLGLAIVIQLILSIIRFRIINIFFELILLVLLLPSLIPILGVITILLGFILSLIEIATFKHSTIYKTVEVRTFNNFKNKDTKKPKTNFKTSKKYPNFKDANFKEK